mgnify:FL=1
MLAITQAKSAFVIDFVLGKTVYTSSTPNSNAFFPTEKLSTTDLGVAYDVCFLD